MVVQLTQTELIPVIRDIVHAQLQQASPARFSSLRRSMLSIDVPLRESDLGCDSLELIRVGNAVANFFNLRDAGVEDLLLTDASISGFAKVVSEARTNTSAFQSDVVCDFTFASSGSTGKSSFWRHHETWLDQEVQYWKQQLAAQLGTVKRIVACVPRCHVYGFIWTVLLPKAIDIEVVELFPEHLFPHKLKTGDVVVGTPSIWSAWDSLGFAWPKDLLGISSTAPLSPNVAKSLASAGLPVIEIYGSTENAGIASRHPSKEHFELMSHYSFDQGDEIDLVRHCPDGLSRRFSLLDNIALAPAASVQASTQFLITGRKDHVVQVNGFNISTQWVAQLIKALEDVEDCAVRKMNPSEGEHLKACLVVKNGAHADELVTRVTKWCAANLPETSRPKHYQIASQLPRNEMGKLADWVIGLEQSVAAH